MDAHYPFPLFSAEDLRVMARQAHLRREQLALGLGYSIVQVDRYLSGMTPLPDAAALRFLQLYMHATRVDMEAWPIAS